MWARYRTAEIGYKARAPRPRTSTVLTHFRDSATCAPAHGIPQAIATMVSQVGSDPYEV